MRTGKISSTIITQAANAYVVVSNSPTAPAAENVDGGIYYDTIAADFKGRVNGQWVSMTKWGRPVFGSIAAQSGSSTYTNSSSAPASTTGTQIFTASYTPTYTTSVIEVSINIIADISASGQLFCFLFRGTTLIGMSTQVINQYTGVLSSTANTPTTFVIKAFDQPSTTNAVTYSARFASSTGTWYVNQAAGFSYGNAASYPGNYSIREHF